MKSVSAWVGVALLVTGAFVSAQERHSDIEQSNEIAPTEQAYDKAVAAVNRVAQAGPAVIPVLDQAYLTLSDGYVFLPMPEAGALMEAMGNHVDSTMAGMVVSAQNEDWMLIIDYINDGHISDDDAKEWNADDLLTSLRDGTEAGNEERRTRGFPEIEVVDWVEPPTYDAQTRRLVWAAESRHKGARSSDTAGVNYNTYMLGREGYVTMNLVTAADKIEQYKPRAHEMLAALEFVEGRRYSDFSADTDKVAAYGLAALVGGLAAKKLGMFALLGVLLAKYAKIILIAVAGGGALAAKLFKRKQS